MHKFFWQAGLDASSFAERKPATCRSLDGAHIPLWGVAAALLLLAGCATRPVNPPVTRIDTSTGYRYETREKTESDRENVVVLAFSGGGTRAAAFAYGVLEVLRKTEVAARDGRRFRLLDTVDVITGVSGGSFTALAYGLYGDKLFDDYEQRFLKRNVEGELFARLLNPANWGSLMTTTWGRSEMAAELYDEILFNGATFADLERGSGPLIIATATDISTGARLGFTQPQFDVLCSDLRSVRLSRAAAASSAVPLVLSPVTINNYGGTCNYKPPPWLAAFEQHPETMRPAERAVRRLKEIHAYEDGVNRPYIHLVDGGLADNLGMRGVLEALETFEALHTAGVKTPLAGARRIVVFVVNSLSVPSNDWDRSERPPGNFALLLKATGVPIDHYSFEAVELLRDTMARWQNLRTIRDSPAFTASKDPVAARITDVPRATIYAIDVSFPVLKDKAELEYLNNLPTSFALPSEAVDRLRAAAAKIVIEAPEFQRLLKEAGARIVSEPKPAAAPPAP
jgi:NTE family protein